MLYSLMTLTALISFPNKTLDIYRVFCMVCSIWYNAMETRGFQTQLILSVV